MPAVFVLMLLSIFPMVQGIVLSLQNRILRTNRSDFVGLLNYVKLFGDSRFWNSLKVSFAWETITVGGSLLVGLSLAFFLYRRFSRTTLGVVTLIFILPAVLPRVAAAYIWRFMYSPAIGIFNYFINGVGLPSIEFLSKRSLALFAVALIDIWQWGLLMSVVILNLLESLPESYLEAAKVDGASNFQIQIHVALPNIVPQLLSLTLIKMVESLRSFDLIYVLTRGGPGISTETLDLYAYQLGIGVAGKVSYAACVSVLMLIVTSLLITGILRASRRWYA